MRLVSAVYAALLAASGAEALRSDNKVLLSKIQSLTLRQGLKTSSRRVSPIPQLKCIGGSGRGQYDVDVMRCKNSGSDYDDNNIQWTCTASLPEEFKLGSTDVICEGYDSPDDPYILKGSCGVEYRLILTDKGKEKYGKGSDGWFGDDDGRSGGPKSMGERIAGGLFWCLFIGVVGWMIYSAFINRGQGGDGGAAGGRPGWGGGGGGGGGGGWGGGYNNDDNNDPPPPYYPNNPGKQQPGYGTNQGWRPGFWSGAAGGAAAGWAAGRMGNNSGNQTGSGWGNGSGSRWGNGESSSRSSSGDSFSNSRHESSGFGSTSRR